MNDFRHTREVRSAAAMIIPLLLGLAACATGDESVAGSVATVIDTVGDTIVARTTGSLPTDQLRTLDVVWRVGEGDDPATSFATITSVAVGPDGRLLVWDSRTPALRVYSADGTLVRAVGRVGGGPGEYRRVNGIAALPDGRWVLWDGGNARINVYAADGTYETKWRVPITGFSTSNALFADGKGHLWLTFSVWAPDNSSRRTAWLRMDQSGATIDTVFAPEPDGVDPELVAREGGSAASYDLPYGRSLEAAPGSHGSLIWAVSAPYLIHSRMGSRVLRIEREWDPVAIPDEERAQQRASTVAGLRMTQPAYTWDGPEISREKPPIESIQSGADGRIWVSISTESERYDPPPPPPGPFALIPQVRYRPVERRWDVFEPDGRYLGRVRAPRNVPPRAVRGNHAWGVWTGDDDVPTLVKLQITPAF